MMGWAGFLFFPNFPLVWGLSRTLSAVMNTRTNAPWGGKGLCELTCPDHSQGSWGERGAGQELKAGAKTEVMEKCCLQAQHAFSYHLDSPEVTPPTVGGAFPHQSITGQEKAPQSYL